MVHQSHIACIGQPDSIFHQSLLWPPPRPDSGPEVVDEVHRGTGLVVVLLIVALVAALVAVVEDLASETRDIALAAVPGRRCKGRNKPWDSGSQAE